MAIGRWLLQQLLNFHLMCQCISLHHTLSYTLQLAARYLSLDQDELMSSLLNSGLGPVPIQGLDLYI